MCRLLSEFDLSHILMLLTIRNLAHESRQEIRFHYLDLHMEKSVFIIWISPCDSFGKIFTGNNWYVFTRMQQQLNFLVPAISKQKENDYASLFFHRNIRVIVKSEIRCYPLLSWINTIVRLIGYLFEEGWSSILKFSSRLLP